MSNDMTVIYESFITTSIDVIGTVIVNGKLKSNMNSINLAGEPWFPVFMCLSNAQRDIKMKLKKVIGAPVSL